METILVVFILILYPLFMIFGGKLSEKSKPTLGKISTLSRQHKLSDKKNSLESVDLKVVRNLAEDHLSGKTSFSDLISLPSETSKLVTLYILEKQIIYIAWSLHVEWSARFKHPDYDSWKDNQYKNSLYKAYIELDRDSKQELMPLYFSPNMETEESVYISEEQYSKKMRDASFLDFSELVGKDGLTINELKQEYILNHEYHYLLPLWTRTLASDEFATPSQIELMNANPDLRNANPKLRK